MKKDYHKSGYWAEYKRGAKNRDKEKVLLVYGGKCNCCGEDTKEFLTIDHINGGGKKHRDSTKVKSKYGSMWTFLRRVGFPKEYRLLCWNCNCSRGAFGYCPHEVVER